MNSIPIYLRLSEQNVQLQKIGTLTREGNLIYNDEGGDFKAHLITIEKFAMLTAASPLIAIAHLVRSIAFPMTGDMQRGGREFIGSLTAPLIAGGCLFGSLLSSAIYAISSGSVSFYANMRRTYAYFEAWINGVDLQNPSLVSYAHRVSAPTDYIGTSDSAHVWTTAPCMQPLLENGYSKKGGLLDAERMKKIYPFLPIDGIRKENDQLVIQSYYINHDVIYTACGGVCEHAQVAANCCCCYRIEATYDRVCCCEVGRGNCSSLIDSGDSCGIVTCGACGATACCCYAKEKDQLATINAGCCFGAEGPGCVTGWSSK